MENACKANSTPGIHPHSLERLTDFARLGTTNSGTSYLMHHHHHTQRTERAPEMENACRANSTPGIHLHSLERSQVSWQDDTTNSGTSCLMEWHTRRKAQRGLLNSRLPVEQTAPQVYICTHSKGLRFHDKTLLPPATLPEKKRLIRRSVIRGRLFTTHHPSFAVFDFQLCKALRTINFNMALIWRWILCNVPYILSLSITFLLDEQIQTFLILSYT